MVRLCVHENLLQLMLIVVYVSIGRLNSVEVVAEIITNDDQFLAKRHLQSVPLGNIVGINVINVVTGTSIGPLVNGSKIFLNRYALTSASQLNFVAITSSTEIGSVKFKVTGNSSITSTENTQPFTVCGDTFGTKNAFNLCYSLRVGESQILAQTYTLSRGSGTAGTPYKVSFTIAITNQEPMLSPRTAPLRMPSKAPLKVPSSKVGSAAPKIPITKSPIIPTKTPVKRITKAPTKLPIKQPASALSPSKTPVRRPTNRPISYVPFNITLQVVGPGVTTADTNVFQNAIKRWEKVVVENIPSSPYLPYQMTFPNPLCIPPSVIDDLYLCAEIKAIDGAGTILGYGGPQAIRDDSKLPITGFMVFDAEDVSWMKSNGYWYSLVLHEIGHVLGIGTMWQSKNLSGSATENCPYFGTHATYEYQVLTGCKGSVPLETDYSEGTRCLHWDEECFQGELMTGFVQGMMPLSRMTIAGLKDIGYTVSYDSADIYTQSDILSSCICKNGDTQQRRITERKAGMRRRYRSLTNHGRRTLSDEGYKKAIAFGTDLLLKLKEQRFPSTSFEMGYNGAVGKLATANVASTVPVIVADFVSVFYVEQEQIFSVFVDIDDINAIDVDRTP
jgi:Leishmanolysin